MKKAIAALLSIGLVVSMFTGCASKGTDSKSTSGSGEKAIKIGVSAPDLTNVFFIQIRDAMKAALKGPNDKLIIQDAAGDQNKQMNDVADMINQGCDIICISSINSEGVRATLEACKNANIPVIAFNTAVKDPSLVKCTVVSDNVAAGKMCAEALAKALNGKGKVVEITYSTTEVCKNRQVGFEEEIAKYPDIKVIQTRDVEKAKSDYSQPIMVDFINANKTIDGVFTINDPTARGAIAALKEAGKIANTKVVSVDGSDEGKGFIRTGEMLASAAQDPAKIGKTCVEVAYDILANKKVEAKVIVPMSIIDKNNVGK